MADKTVVEWFDPHNPKHLKAYLHLKEEGVWPKGFIPKGQQRDAAFFCTLWEISLAHKMARLWAEEKLV